MQSIAGLPGWQLLRYLYHVSLAQRPVVFGVQDH